MAEDWTQFFNFDTASSGESSDAHNFSMPTLEPWCAQNSVADKMIANDGFVDTQQIEQSIRATLSTPQPMNMLTSGLSQAPTVNPQGCLPIAHSGQFLSLADLDGRNNPFVQSFSTGPSFSQPQGPTADIRNGAASTALPMIPEEDLIWINQTYHHQVTALQQTAVVPGSAFTSVAPPVIPEEDLFNMGATDSTVQKPMAFPTVNMPMPEPSTVVDFQPAESLQGTSYDTGKKYIQNARYPFEQWTSFSGTVFSYNTFNEVQTRMFSTNDIYEFITQHPVNGKSRLTLWIQRAPTGCSKRYQHHKSDACIFKECPARVYGLQGTITRGHFRIAFDEMYSTYGDQVDPYHCTAYAHLYCIERFLNLPELLALTNIDVRIDDRTLLRNEPNGKFAAALLPQAVYVANRFVQAVRSGRLQAEFPRYPTGAEKKEYEYIDLHRGTLNHAMQFATQKTRNKEVRRRQGPTNVAQHLGDVEMFSAAHKKVRVEQGKRVARAMELRKEKKVAVALERQRGLATKLQEQVMEPLGDDHIMEESDEDSLFVGDDDGGEYVP